jgi:hypothetical protein
MGPEQIAGIAVRAECGGPEQVSRGRKPVVQHWFVTPVRLHLGESIGGKMWPLLPSFDRSWHPPAGEGDRAEQADPEVEAHAPPLASLTMPMGGAGLFVPR